jgi:hypothetical protein
LLNIVPCRAILILAIADSALHEYSPYKGILLQLHLVSRR